MKLSDLQEMHLHIVRPLTFERMEDIVGHGMAISYGITSYERHDEKDQAAKNVKRYMTFMSKLEEWTKVVRGKTAAGVTRLPADGAVFHFA